MVASSDKELTTRLDMIDMDTILTAPSLAACHGELKSKQIQ